METVYKREGEAGPDKIYRAGEAQAEACGKAKAADGAKAFKIAETGDIVFIPVKNVIINPFVAKQQYSGRTLERLRIAIMHGIELRPIYVRVLKTDLYELIAGDKWLTAAKMAGLEKVPAIIFDLEDGESALKQLLRWPNETQLHYFEEAEAYRLLIDSGKYIQSDLAGIVGKSQSAIANKLRLLRYSPQIRSQIVEAGLSERHAREILKLTDERLQQLAVKMADERRLSVSETEQLVAELQREHDLLGWFLAENRHRIPSGAGSKRKEGLFVRGNNVKNLKQIISILRELVFCAKEYGLTVQAGQRTTDAAVEFLIKVPKRENGINVRRAGKNTGIIEKRQIEDEPVREAA